MNAHSLPMPGKLSNQARDYVRLGASGSDLVRRRIVEAQNAVDSGDSAEVKRLCLHHTIKATQDSKSLCATIVEATKAIWTHELDGHSAAPHIEVIPPILANADLRRRIQYDIAGLYSRLTTICVLSDEHDVHAKRKKLESVIESVAQLSAQVDKTHRRVIRGHRGDCQSDHSCGPQRVQIKRMRANTALLLPLRSIWDQLEAISVDIIATSTSEDKLR
jgi:hypothetical protein